MNNEEFDRKMEFLVNQQAQFDANIQQLKEAQKVTDQTVMRAAETLAQTTETLAHLTTLTIDGFKFTVDRFNDTDAKIDALVDSQIQTAELIRNIGSKLDRHLNEDHSSA